MAAENRKITELDLNKPSRDHNFVVATPEENFRLLYHDVAEFSSIDTQSGTFLETLTISGVPVSTGDMSAFEERFDDLSGYIDAVSGNVDIVSGNLHETGQILEEKIERQPDTFVFFNDIVNNDGPCIKTYYDSPTPNTFLSGVIVNTAKDLNVSLQWDGPFDGYAGTGHINGVPIPLSNTQELGSQTRRFQGHIDNLDAAGSTVISGMVNGSSAYGVSGFVTLEEVGPDPFAEDLFLDSIVNCIPAPGMLKGTDALKAGDILNVFVDFDPTKVVDPRQEITGVQVANSGISIGTDWIAYNPTTLANGIERVTIPVTISNRDGDHGVAVRASNKFGAIGDFAVSNIHFVGFDDSRLLDQAYPIITVSADGPTSYNGRTDGLREGETTQLTNSISNWDILIDHIDYSFSSYNGTNVTIDNPNVFENPKTLRHNAGIFVDQSNLTITATRFFNGSISSSDSKVKVANAPEIVDITMSSTAISAAAPHQIGTTDIKGGDTIRTLVSVDTQGSDPDEILISVIDSGISDGTQSSLSKKWTGTPTPLGGDVYQYTVDVFVTSESSRDGLQRVEMKASNEYGTVGEIYASVGQIEVDNVGPTISIDSITYPAGQQAIKFGDSAIVSTTATNHDQAEYAKPDGLSSDQLDIQNPSTYEASKSCGYYSGGYNISEDNFKVKLIKSTNGMVAEATDRVNIANDPLTITFNDLPSKLLSSPAGETYRFTMSSDQLFNNIPTLSLSTSQTVSSVLTTFTAGVGLNSNVFDIYVDDTHTKGSFDFNLVAFNLANVETNISNPPQYNIEGFTAREIEAHPNDLFGGIADIGTQVTVPSNVTFENLSEAGPGPNGGTEYSLDSTISSQVEFDIDKDDQFFICDSAGSPSSIGPFVFNLDALSRASNADVRHPARFLVKED